VAIDTDKVEWVRLASGERLVVRDQSFTLDSYEFVEDGHTIHRGGQSWITGTGFTFKTEEGVVVAGPLTAIEAVELAP
jgi:hypothetical protein